MQVFALLDRGRCYIFVSATSQVHKETGMVKIRSMGLSDNVALVWTLHFPVELSNTPWFTRNYFTSVKFEFWEVTSLGPQEAKE